MIVLGLLLILGIAGLSLAVFLANDGVFAAPAGTIELLGNQLDTAVGEVFLAGAASGGLALLAVFMLFNGMRRSVRRRSANRNKMREQHQQMRDLQHKHDATTSDLAAQRAANESAAKRDEVLVGR